jgi:hypothetical protein
MSKPLRVWSRVYYLTEVEGVTWRAQDYTGHKIVQAVKGKPIKGYFELLVGGKVKKFEQSNIGAFMPILFNTIGKKIAELTKGPIDIVPIPNSTAVVGSKDDFKTLSHAEAIAEAVGDRATAIPALRWKVAKKPAHEGGSRDPQVLFENLRLVKKPSNSVVLFDDVVTTGSQMVAAYRRLSQEGHTPTLGIAIGRATKVQMEHALSWDEEDLETEHKPFDWDDF